jgi:alpha-glucosidase
MPYLYSTFYEAVQTGMPIARSLCIDSPFDGKIYESPYQYQFLCGDAILVVPVTTAEKVKKYYLPKGKWYDLYTDELIDGQQELSRECNIYEIPLFIRSSSIIPMQRLVQSTKAEPGDTLFVHIYNGDEKNVFEYYEDDGSTMDYQKENYYKRSIIFDPLKNEIVFTPVRGNYVSSFKIIRCIFHGFDEINELKVNEEEGLLHGYNIKLLDGLRYLEDIYDPWYYKSLREKEKFNSQQTIIFQQDQNEIVIKWQ